MRMKEVSFKVLLSLQKQDARDILAVSTLFTDWDHAHPMPWTPCIDTHADVPIVPRKIQFYLVAKKKCFHELFAKLVHDFFYVYEKF